MSIAAPDPGDIAKIENPLKFKSVETLILGTVDIVTKLGALIAVFFIIYAGFLFVTSQGNPSKRDKAKEAFLWAIIGTAVLLGANVIAKIIKGTIDQIHAQGPVSEEVVRV